MLREKFNHDLINLDKQLKNTLKIQKKFRILIYKIIDIIKIDNIKRKIENLNY